MSLLRNEIAPSTNVGYMQSGGAIFPSDVHIRVTAAGLPPANMPMTIPATIPGISASVIFLFGFQTVFPAIGRQATNMESKRLAFHGLAR